MGKFTIIDPVTSTRSILYQQLCQIKGSDFQQLKSYEEAMALFKLGQLYDGVIFAAAGERNDDLVSFVQLLRTKNQHTCVIAMADKLSLEEMRKIVACGVDHILVRPFSLKQIHEKIEASEKFRLQVQNEQKAPDAGQFEAPIQYIMSQAVKVTLIGWLDEKGHLPQILLMQRDATLFIDCEKLKGINSVGIRNWVLWFKELQQIGFSRFEFENLHSNFLQAVNSIKGFLPADSFISSFYINYWSEELDTDKEFKFIFGRDYATDKMIIPKQREEAVNGKNVAFEIDASIQKDLKFYKGKIEIK